MKTILIDASNLAHQAAHVFYNEAGPDEAVVYGLLCRMLFLGLGHKTNRIACCFDSPPYLRRKLLPTYKANRKATTPDKAEWMSDLFRQVGLFKDALRTLGMVVCEQKGMEADDMIAGYVKSRDARGEFVIASRDHDLYQLLSPTVSITAKQGQLYTAQAFEDQWKLSPDWWTTMKAIAGDDGDNVPGLDGVGLITAAKFIRREIVGELSNGGNVPSERIRSFIRTEQYRDNVRLVNLPYGPVVVAAIPPLPHDFMGRLELVAVQHGFDSFLHDPMGSKWRSFATGRWGSAPNKADRQSVADRIKRRIRR